MTLPQSVKWLPLRTLSHHFVVIYLIVAAILTLALAIGMHLDANSRLERTKVRESARIEIARNRLLQDLSFVSLDLNIIAKLPAMQRFVDSGDAVQRNELTKFFMLLSGESGRYDQIRYLDSSGLEIIRINHNDGAPAVVPSNQLQNKSGRYFFHDTLELNQGEIFVSPLDLNIEHGQLETPHKPMIRFGMPIFDSAGRKKGVVLLNYFGDQLLQHFRDVMQGGDTRIAMLLNRDGYWLSGEKREHEWGFMLNRPDLIFASDFPTEWKRIAANDSGFLRSSAGLFVYTTVFPLQAGQHSSSGSPLPRAPSQHDIDTSEYQWKIVTLTPAEALLEQGMYRQPGNRTLIFATYLFIALAAFLVAYLNLKRKQAASELIASESRMREITSTMSDGLIVIGHDGRIQFANPEAGLLLGYEHEELLGEDMHDLLHVHTDGSPITRDACPVLSIAKSGETYRSVEELFRRKNGTLLPVSVSASAMQKEQRIGDIVVAFHDITKRKALEKELEHRAHTDVLTGLNNRRHFYELAEQEFTRDKRYGTSLAALMLDIDHFKKINDSHGHHVGDIVLQTLSDICRKTFRETDIIGRLGGEEFAVLLPQTDNARAMEVAERLRAAVAASGTPLDQAGSLHFSVSIGATSLLASDENVDTMLMRADAAMYSAKNTGRNRVCSNFVTST